MQWTNEMTLSLLLAATLCVYLWGIRNLWRRAGAGHGISFWRSFCFVGAIIALLAALVSPLEELSGELFYAHMVQHMILILVAAPLLVTGDFPQALLWALPRRWAHVLAPGLYHAKILTRVWRGVSNPISAWLLFTVALWVWHASLLFESALRDENIHALEHLGFLLTAMLFWRVLFERGGPDHVHYGLAVPYLFATVLQSTLLGALMTFSSQLWYPYYAGRTASWGLAPLQDQQLAGLIMWIPGGFVFSVLTIGYFAAWLGALERRSVRLKHRNYLRTLPQPDDASKTGVDISSGGERQAEPL